MAGVLYFLGGLMAGASWALVGFTAARYLWHSGRITAGRLVLWTTLAGIAVPAIVNRPRYTPIGIIVGAVLGLILLGLGHAGSQHDEPPTAGDDRQLPPPRPGMLRASLGRGPITPARWPEIR